MPTNDSTILGQLSRRRLVQGAAAASAVAAAQGFDASGVWATQATPAAEAAPEFVPVHLVSPDYYIPDRFKDKVMLITGGAMGSVGQGVTNDRYMISIGAATAIRAAREGARLVLVDVKQDGLAETLKRVEEAGGEAIVIEGDVTETDVCDAMVEAAVKEYGRIDYALNAAGVLDGNNPAAPVDYNRPEDEALAPALLHQATDAYWDRVLAVNATGVFKSLRSELRQFVAQGDGGAIVNIGSIAGLTGLNGNPAYSASKHAVTGITRNAALDYARFGVRVNSVNMASTDTPMVFRAMSYVMWARANRPTGAPIFKSESILSMVNPQHPGATPWEQAAPILFLLSDDASNLTGAVYATDGGWTAY